MELRHLRYFVAIAEEHSFSRAAERLWVAQPGLSSQIRRLESELGIRLFDRHTRGVTLTAAGELFLERARAALAAAEVARSTGHDLELGLAGTLRLGLAAETPARSVPALLTSCSDAHPGVEVTVFESYAGTVVRELRDGRLDAVVVPSAFAAADLHSVPLSSEPWVVLAGHGHRLGHPGPIHARELDGEPIVVSGHRDGAAYDRAVTDMLTGLGLSPLLHRGGPGPALFAAVATGEALALSTQTAAAGSGLVARPLEPARHVRFALLSRDAVPSPALGALIRAATTSGADAAYPALAAVA
jgi:DNA-binding transcriptional LysR family regulator